MDDPYIPVKDLFNEFVGPPKPIRVMVVGLTRHGFFNLEALQYALAETSERNQKILILEAVEQSGFVVGNVGGFEGVTLDTSPKKDINDLVALHLQMHMPLVEAPLRFLGEDNNLGEQVSPYGPAPRKIGGHLRRYALGVKSKKRKER